MPLLETKGAASAQGFGGAGAGASSPVYIEDVFSTYLYTGNGSTQTITNGIDLSGKGGLVWIKGRSNATDHALYDTTRGATKDLVSNSTAAETTQSTGLTAFSGTGFSIGALAKLNTNAATYVSWTIREQPKFFDIVTYTGNGSVPRSIAHNLGSVPGFIAIKLTSGADNWICRHRSTGDTPNDMTNYVANDRLFLNTTGAAGSSSNIKADATTFTVNHTGDLNANGATYVAYLFAHNAGGFGLTGTDNVIQCGSFTTDGSGAATIELGWEPQWLLIKRTDATNIWQISDVMRGMSVSSSSVYLQPQSSSAESTAAGFINAPTPTGFVASTGYSASATYIYIAIRRGPMRTPTSGTSVFSPVAYTGNATNTTLSAGFPVDMLAILRRSNPFGDGDGNPRFMDRLRGGNSTSLISSGSSAEETSTNNTLYLDNSVGFKTTANNPGAPTGYYFNVSTNPYIAECFRRAPGFFDVVCFYATAGTAGSPTQTFNHNLGVTPELAISKTRGTANSWFVYSSTLGTTKRLRLQSDGAEQTPPYFTALTSSTFTIDNYNTGTPADNNVAYLFATCAGVSKVGSYTGTGALQTVNCGFTGGARFVLIKRTDSTGDWYVYDSARGISSSSDPYLFLNSTAAETTGTNYVDTTSVGFQVTAAAPAGLNANGGTYIFLAIA